MSELDDLARRITALEARMKEVARDAGAARVLASGADGDVSELRAVLRSHTSVLNTIRSDQLQLRLELTNRIDQLEARLDAKVDHLEARLDTKVGQLDTKVDQLDAKVDQLDAKIDIKVDQLDAKIDTKVDQLRSGQEEILRLLRERG
ncbi:hypothetical protein GCM10012275_28830 [Longimycelium tulufanense]|uniref:Uncharacterized protein n=1 Tax=Longimycelium tulufanense TaxID=907463 RepID=A0A8J3CF05_9PSEU|nr:hypothetical protein [Longimycelium tulufanense]GGM55936.1 hypothetical protein GCM10012275_28830 [Longimycelium tulufanense]